MTWPVAIVIMSGMAFLAWLLYLLKNLAEQYIEHLEYHDRLDKQANEAAERAIQRMLRVPGPFTEAMDALLKQRGLVKKPCLVEMDVDAVSSPTVGLKTNKETGAND